jgi:hypothetical protein
MLAKRDDYEDEEDSEKPEEKKSFSLGISTIILGILFLIICEIFLYLLSTKIEAIFGFTQIIFGILLALVLTLFFSWTNYIMYSNKYLGAIIGIVGTGSSVYALTRKFTGIYTTTFVIIGAIISIGYLLIHFLKIKSE